MKSFSFRYHALNRFKERFPKKVDEFDGDVYKAVAVELYKRSKEDRTYLNNTPFMIYLGERYGYDRKYSFYVSDDCVFVCIEKAIVTVLDKKGSHVHDPRPRFRSSRR